MAGENFDQYLWGCEEPGPGQGRRITVWSPLRLQLTPWQLWPGHHSAHPPPRVQLPLWNRPFLPHQLADQLHSGRAPSPEGLCGLHEVQFLLEGVLGASFPPLLAGFQERCWYARHLRCPQARFLFVWLFYFGESFWVLYCVQPVTCIFYDTL